MIDSRELLSIYEIDCVLANGRRTVDAFILNRFHAFCVRPWRKKAADELSLQCAPQVRF
jgi:hypothetical protein